jgi:hypothetical protein
MILYALTFLCAIIWGSFIVALVDLSNNIME